MEYKIVSNDRFDLKSIIIGTTKTVLISFLITILLILLLSFLITYTDISSSVAKPYTIIVTILSIIFASILNGKKTSEKGWLNGTISGLIYMLILYITGSFTFMNFSINSNSITMFIVGLLSGALGGIIGINNKGKTKKPKK